MKKIKTLLIFSIIFLIFQTSCEGPAGEAGPAGPAGQQGIAGAKGDKGDAGTANVFSSTWKTVKPTDWFTYDDDPGFFGIFFLDKNITPNLLEKGMFLCFNRDTDDKTFVWPMPVSNIKGQYNYYLYNDPKDPETGVGIYLDYYDDRKTIDFSLDFRWVFIPEVTIKNGRKKNIDWHNYEEVKKELNLKD